MSKVIGIYVKFAKTTHQIWSCHVTLASKSENFYFTPNSVLNFRKRCQIWGKLAQEQKVTGKKLIGGWNPPSAYRIKQTEEQNFSQLTLDSNSTLFFMLFLQLVSKSLNERLLMQRLQPYKLMFVHDQSVSVLFFYIALLLGK